MVQYVGVGVSLVSLLQSPGTSCFTLLAGLDTSPSSHLNLGEGGYKTCSVLVTFCSQTPFQPKLTPQKKAETSIHQISSMYQYVKSRHLDQNITNTLRLEGKDIYISKKALYSHQAKYHMLAGRPQRCKERDKECVLILYNIYNREITITRDVKRSCYSDEAENTSAC